MRILFVVPYPPNLIRVRPYNLIRHLRDLGHDVTVATLWTSDEERAAIEQLREDGFRVITYRLPRWRTLLNLGPAAVVGKPLQSVYSWHPEFARQLAAGVGANGHGPYDVVHVEHLRGSRYGLYLQEHTDTPVVWDSVDCISLLFEQAQVQSRSRFGRLMTRFELGRTRRYERKLVNTFDPILVTSPIDRSALLDLVPEGAQPPAISAFHGVDIDYFRPNPAVSRDPATVVVTGKMSYHANVTMVLRLAQDIMPLVWQTRPDAHLFIVGKAPVSEIQALAARPTITVTGQVDDMRPYLHRATLAAAPIAYGAGVQNKLLEAMACATPVVTTPQGSAALDVVPGRDLLQATDNNAFAAAIIQLIDDPELQERIGQAGYQQTTNQYSWARSTVHLEKVYHETIRRYRQ